MNISTPEASVADAATIDVVDVHVGGDLHRIVLGGIKPLRGTTVLNQMESEGRRWSRQLTRKPMPASLSWS